MINVRNTKSFCKDFTKIENYEKAIADDKTWHLHHRLETHFSNGAERPVNARLTKAELIALDMYFDRPAEELIFLTQFDHTSLHMKGKITSDEAKQKISEANKDKWRTEEYKQKMSKIRKGRTTWMKGKHHSEETKRKISETKKGKSSWNKGKTGIYSEEYKRKLSESHKGKHWKLDENGKRVWY